MNLLANATVAKNSPDDYIELHNAARAVAGAGQVSWDAEASRHTAMRAQRVVLGLCSREGRLLEMAVTYGEKVFRATPGMGWSAGDTVRAWTAPEARDYAQVVWPRSNRISCAHAVCAGEHGVVVTCRYKPAGN